MMCEVRLEYRNGDGTRAWMSVSRDSLVLDGFEFTPDDIVEIRIRRGWLTPATLVIDHVLFEQMPNEVIISPVGESCELLLERIRITGFRPRAQPMTPWLPPEPPSPLA